MNGLYWSVILSRQFNRHKRMPGLLKSNPMSVALPFSDFDTNGFKLVFILNLASSGAWEYLSKILFFLHMQAINLYFEHSNRQKAKNMTIIKPHRPQLVPL